MSASRRHHTELDERRYLKEKVVAAYEALWRGEEAFADGGFFHLKVNASWLQAHIAALPQAEMATGRAVLRRLFVECCSRLSPDFEASVQSHAMETLAGVFLGIGCRTFHNVADVLDLLCSIEAADAAFGGLFAQIKALLSSKRRGAEAVALRRSAVRLLLALAAAAADLQSNILIDLLMPHRFDVPLGVLLHSVDGVEPPSSAARPSEREDVATLVLLLASYRRHESPNSFLRCVPPPP